MLDFLLSLLPDDVGEFLGFGLLGGCSYMGIKHMSKKVNAEKYKGQEMEEKLNKIILKQSDKIKKNCLSDEAMDFIKDNFQEEK